MAELVCSTKGCSNKFEYHHIQEDSYYCEGCAYFYFKENEFEKIGSVAIIMKMIELSKNILDKVKQYVSDELLAIKWKIALDEHKILYSEVEDIKSNLDSVLKVGCLTDLLNIKRKVIDLKSKVTDSEAYRRYLLHKDLSEHKSNKKLSNVKLPSSPLSKGLTDTKFEIEKLSMAESLKKWKDIFELKPDLPGELEEIEKKHSEEISEIRKQQNLDKENYEKAKLEWLNQRTEIEQELENIKAKLELPQTSNCISYDVFQNLYSKFIGETVALNSFSTIIFSLNEEKWLDLFKIICKLNLPKFNKCSLHSVLPDSDEVRSFLSTSISELNSFLFNNDERVTVNASNYISSLKLAASKTLNQFVIGRTKFSCKEFCDLISAAKRVKEIHFQHDTIALDEPADFGDMEGSKVERIGFYESGGIIYSNWKDNPNRFENFIAGVAKSQGLKASLKALSIGKCEISKEQGEAVLKKYKLNEIILQGV